KQLEVRFEVGFCREHRAVDAEGFDRKRLCDKGLLRQHVAARGSAIVLDPEPMAMEERRAVALAQCHGREFEPGEAKGTKGLAVERAVLAGLGQRRHDIAERAERAAFDIERAARKTLRGKTAPRRFEQGQPRLKCKGKGAAARFRPLVALGHWRSRLL